MNPEDGIGVAEFSEERIKNDVLEAKKLFERAVFSGSASLPAEAEPSREVQSREAEVRDIIRAFFEFLERVCVGEVRVVARGIKNIEEEGRTYTKATIELAGDRETIPHYQIWLTGIELKEVDETVDPEERSRRIDNKLETAREAAISELMEIARMDTERAVERKSGIWRRIVECSSTYIESWQIQFQIYKGKEGGRHQTEPLVGIRIERYLDGYQAYPVLFLGREVIVGYGKPLLPGSLMFPEEIREFFGNSPGLSLVSKEEMKSSPLWRILKILDSKAFPQPSSKKTPIGKLR